MDTKESGSPRRIRKIKVKSPKRDELKMGKKKKKTRKIAVSRKLGKNETQAPLSPLRSEARERNGRILRRSVLGDVCEFSDMRRVREGHEERDRSETMNKLVSGTRARSRALLKVSKMARATKKRVKERDELQCLDDERSAQVKRISFLCEDAKRVREESDVKTKLRLDKMRIHERLRYEKEKKVLESFRKIQASRETYKAIAIEKVKKKPDELVQARSDMYREIREEFDIHEKIIPQSEKNRSSYWLMSLRNDGTRYVRVGNMFSGLFCAVKNGDDRVHAMVRVCVSVCVCVCATFKFIHYTTTTTTTTGTKTASSTIFKGGTTRGDMENVR
jgi:hypothetical protein